MAQPDKIWAKILCSGNFWSQISASNLKSSLKAFLGSMEHSLHFSILVILVPEKAQSGSCQNETLTVIASLFIEINVFNLEKNTFC